MRPGVAVGYRVRAVGQPPDGRSLSTTIGCGRARSRGSIVHSFGLQHDRLRPAFVVGSRQPRQDLVDELLDAGALNQGHGGDLESERGFQPVDERHRHQ